MKNSVKMPDGQNSERESITGDAAKLTLLLPLLSKNNQTAPRFGSACPDRDDRLSMSPPTEQIIHYQ